MYRLTVFRDGGTIEYDKNSDAVPMTILNELIAQECIETSRSNNQAQIRLGRSGEFTARISRDAEAQITVALILPVALRLISDPEALVRDVAKVYASVGREDRERFAQLVEIRLKNSETKPAALQAAGAADIEGDGEDLAKPREAAPARGVAAPSAPKAKGKKAAADAKKAKSKKKRIWDGGLASEEDGDVVLDYSEAGRRDAGDDALVEQLDAVNLGSKSKDGFVVKELTDELGDILSSPDAADGSGASSLQPFGFLKRFTGGKKLSEKDLDKVLQAMEDHLVVKNVAKEVATSICDGVRRDLVGTSTDNWTTVSATVRASMKRTLSKILTPATSTDLLAQIRKRKEGGGAGIGSRLLSSGSASAASRRPYVISVVGVNGVGKSTNLGKLGFWFLQNDFKVLVAACDTFRSGAVEQLQVHVQRLKQLKGRSSGSIELFDQGYGKDAAVIAKRAVEHAAKHDFDVVLIDTAGRRHNDDRLMSSLEKFGDLAQPDKIIMVGEALVGTDSVEQARNFDAAFGKSRGLDFFLISKCDTVGEMLGTLVNVTFATGVPVLFVGVGQQYTDLRTLSVDWAVNKLLA